MTQQKTKPNHAGFEVLIEVVMNITGILLGLFNPEDGSDMFLRNVG
jgi:hypothetical protein